MDTAFNPFLPTVAFSQLSSNMCCPRDCVFRHNGSPAVLPFCRETQSLGQQMLIATVGIYGLSSLVLWGGFDIHCPKLVFICIIKLNYGLLELLWNPNFYIKFPKQIVLMGSFSKYNTSSIVLQINIHLQILILIHIFQ